MYTRAPALVLVPWFTASCKDYFAYTQHDAVSIQHQLFFALRILFNIEGWAEEYPLSFLVAVDLVPTVF